jgi:hypothetical protein
LFKHKWGITKYQAFNEEAAVHKKESKTRLLLLAALAIVSIGLTTYDAPIIYSESSSDGEDEKDGQSDQGQAKEDEKEKDGQSDQGQAKEDEKEKDGQSDQGPPANYTPKPVDPPPYTGEPAAKETAPYTPQPGSDSGSTKTAGEEHSLSTLDTKTYTDTHYGISADYPSDWQISDIDSDPNDSSIEVAHIYPSSQTGEKIEITIEDRPTSDLTLEDYLQSTTEFYQNYFGGINVLESDTHSTVAGKPAYMVVFTSKDGTAQIMETGFIVGDKVYYMAYTAKPDSYRSHITDVQNMAKSLKISK